MIGRMLRALDWLDDHPRVTAVLLAATAAGGAALIALSRGLPAPAYHDEFSFLLAADTFASGRIANPPHPFWQHFETFHVLQQPTYVSKYPPAQGLILGFGQAVGGHPIIGVWLSVGLMVACMYWMFRAWVPGRWALLGGLLVLMQLGVSSYWAQSYWGGAVAATGGALLFGATRRLSDSPRGRDALMLGIGIAILANSRPFEGLIVSLFAAAALAWAFFRKGPAFRDTFIHRAILPILLVITLAGGAMGTYNYATTGDVFRMPYEVYSDTYSMGSFLPWKEPRLDLEFRHPSMREYAEQWGVARLRSMRDGRVALLKFVTWSILNGLFLVGAFAVLPLLGLSQALQSRWIRLAAITTATLWILTQSTAAYPHYLAPAAALVYVIVLESSYRLWSWNLRGLSGSLFVAATIVAELFYAGIAIASNGIHPIEHYSEMRAFGNTRERIRGRLISETGRDLIVVKYGPDHSYHQEWVYNRADVEASDIVWARDMGESENRRLIDHFPDRNVWLLTAGYRDSTLVGSLGEHMLLKPYPNTRTHSEADDQ